MTARPAHHRAAELLEHDCGTVAVPPDGYENGEAGVGQQTAEGQGVALAQSENLLIKRIMAGFDHRPVCKKSVGSQRSTVQAVGGGRCNEGEA